jgi:uncharacterized metal-binding protein (TIGR02443 family)
MKHARFIAGARCRACGEVDRIVVEDSADGRVQRCVACGHRETMPQDVSDDATIIRIPLDDASDTKVD